MHWPSAVQVWPEPHGGLHDEMHWLFTQLKPARHAGSQLPAGGAGSAGAVGAAAAGAGAV
jgi:hypothetical protein